MLSPTQSLRSIDAHLQEEQSASSPLLQNHRLGYDETVGADENRRSIADGPDRLTSAHNLGDEDIELDDIGDVTHEASSAIGAEIGDSNIWIRNPSLSLNNPSASYSTSAQVSNSSLNNLTTHSKASTSDEDLLYARIEFLSPWFPQVDPNHRRAQTWRTWRSRQDVLLTTAALTSMFVLVVEVIVTIVLQSKYKSTGGVVSIYEGSCSWVKNVDIVAHILINALSTLLLGASNLCMQLLAAPTRAEVDKAHKKRRWLDIGVPSWRNLKSISRTRRLMWFILGLSSVPLHFIYNSAISSSLASYGYAAAVVNEKFIYANSSTDIQGPLYNSCQSCSAWPQVEGWEPVTSLFQMQRVASDGHTLVNRSKTDCLNVLTDMYGARKNTIIVTQDASDTEAPTILQYAYVAASWTERGIYWPCDDGAPGSKSANWAGGPDCGNAGSVNASSLERWKKFDRPVLYCLSAQPTGDHCRLNYSPAIMITICCVSTLKCLCIAFTAYWLYVTCQEPLCTIGDAISSFLDQKDKCTTKLGIATRDSLQKNKTWEADAAQPIEWHSNRVRWYAAASRRRWIFTMSICGLAIVTATVSMASGAHGTMNRIRTRSFLKVLRLGFGIANPNAFTAYFLPKHGTKGFISNVLWANYWQIIISFLYLAYNALLTCQLVSEEWGGYAAERKTLRVSHPKGIQRSSYFISMPMKYGIPLLCANATLHWLISQSVFVVSTTTYFPGDVEDTSQSFTTTGYSTSASLASICFGIFMLILFIANAMRHLPSGMPLASTCSAAISAACHRPSADTEAHLLPVQWGFIPSTADEPQRYAFTTYRKVKAPKEGDLYLGLPG